MTDTPKDHAELRAVWFAATICAGTEHCRPLWALLHRLYAEAEQASRKRVREKALNEKGLGSEPD